MNTEVIHERTSVLLIRVAANSKGEALQFGHIVQLLHRRSFGGVFIMLAILSLIPGISIFSGLAMLIPALQLTLGFPAPHFPGFIREREIDPELLGRFTSKASRWIANMERYVQPRWFILTSPVVVRPIGVLLACLAVVVAIPIPFSNFLPILAILCIAFGILERDGLVILVGAIFSCVALSIGISVVYGSFLLLKVAFSN